LGSILNVVIVEDLTLEMENMSIVDHGEVSKMQDYDIVEQIGRGAFGTAYLVLHKLEPKKK